MDSFTSMSLGLPMAPAKPKKGKGSPKAHLAKAQAAHASGDHAVAKRHALNAAKALHAITKPDPAAC